MALFNRLRGGRGAMSPLLKLVLAAIAYRSLTRGKGRLAALIAGRLGRSGGLASLLGGGAGGVFFGAVLHHFLEALRRQNGPTATPEPDDGLSEEVIQWLMERTGMSRSELMADLRRFSRDHQ